MNGLASEYDANKISNLIKQPILIIMKNHDKIENKSILLVYQIFNSWNYHIFNKLLGKHEIVFMEDFQQK